MKKKNLLCLFLLFFFAGMPVTGCCEPKDSRVPFYVLALGALAAAALIADRMTGPTVDDLGPNMPSHNVETATGTQNEELGLGDWCLRASKGV